MSLAGVFVVFCYLTFITIPTGGRSGESTILSGPSSSLIIGYTVFRDGFVFQNYELNKEKTAFEVALVFRTLKHNGLIFYGSSNDSFLSIELYYGSIRVSGQFSENKYESPYIGYAGAGLADGKSHQIEIYKGIRDMAILIDRGTKRTQSFIFVSSLFTSSTNFDELYLANHPQLDTFDSYQSLSRQSFEGCFELATWDNINILQRPIFEGAVPYCENPIEKNSITFLAMDSYIMLYRPKSKELGLHMEFELLVYQNWTTIIKHVLNGSEFHLRVVDGLLQITLFLEGQLVINAVSPAGRVSDGVWHKVKIVIPGSDVLEPRVVFTVDGHVIDSPSPVAYNAGRELQFGGFGFIGCIDNVKLDDAAYKLEKHYKRKGISTIGCNITFQCNPNPCVNGGRCIALEGLDYNCECLTNYNGENCENPSSPPTCSEMHKLNLRKNGINTLDIDGIGLYEPVKAECLHMDTYLSDRCITSIEPTKTTYSLINAPKSWEIEYGVSVEMLNLLAENSEYCTQAVIYQCTRSKITDGNTTLMNWVGGDGQVHDYWNEQGVYGVCQCALGKNKCAGGNNCNCDRFDTVSRSDEVEFAIKSHLPITRVNAMNISSSLGSSATLIVKPLRCKGFGGKPKAVTFQEVFSYLLTDPLNLWNAGSFELEFRTNQAAGNIILYSRGRVRGDFVLLYLKNSTAIAVTVNLGAELSHDLSVQLMDTYHPHNSQLDDQEYHSVKFQINRRRFSLTLDGVTNSYILQNNISSGILLNLDNLHTYLGANPSDRFSGFKGTIRNYKINGRVQDIYGLAEKESILGVVPGTNSACSRTSNPCNSGECVDNYNYYVCDCSHSPFYGSHCHEERGITANGYTYALHYPFTKVMVLAKLRISIGFVTTLNTATLFSLQNTDEGLYFIGNIENGRFVLHYRLSTGGATKKSAITIDSDKLKELLSNYQLHIVKIELKDDILDIEIDRKRWSYTVDDHLKSKTTFENPESLYVGGASHPTSFKSGNQQWPNTHTFVGCITGMKMSYETVDNPKPEIVDPVWLYYRDSTEVQGGNIKKQSCGNHKFAANPNAPLIPFPPNPVPGDTSSVERRLPLKQTWGPTVLGLTVYLFFLLVLILLFAMRWRSRNTGIYKTDEGNPDKTGVYVDGIAYDNDSPTNDPHSPIPDNASDNDSGYI